MIVVVSKTFTTQETMANAIAKEWLVKGGGSAEVQMAAVSTNVEGTRAFGIPESQTFGFENWVGGRYSMWGPVGLCIAMSLGSDGFSSFLRRCEDGRPSFQGDATSRQRPCLVGPFGALEPKNLLKHRSHVVLPYAEDLIRLPAYLQQADMESNGKFVERWAAGKLEHWCCGLGRTGHQQSACVLAIVASRHGGSSC